MPIRNSLQETDSLAPARLGASSGDKAALLQCSTQTLSRDLQGKKQRLILFSLPVMVALAVGLSNDSCTGVLLLPQDPSITAQDTRPHHKKAGILCRRAHCCQARSHALAMAEGAACWVRLRSGWIDGPRVAQLWWFT